MTIKHHQKMARSCCSVMDAPLEERCFNKF
jgi:hypothetical protein